MLMNGPCSTQIAPARSVFHFKGLTANSSKALFYINNFIKKAQREQRNCAPATTQAEKTKVWVADAVNTRDGHDHAACHDPTPRRAECAPGKQIGMVAPLVYGDAVGPGQWADSKDTALGASQD